MLNPFPTNYGENRINTFIDRPFGCPLDTVLDIPVPPSLNKARKIDWRHYPEVKGWRIQCDKHLMTNGQFRKARAAKLERYEITIILDETKTRLDLGNVEKLINDYLKRIDLVVDDGPKYCRRIVIEFGEAPDGCRVVLKGHA